MTSKHTSGPWFCGCFRENGNSSGVDIGAENGSNIALCHHQESDRSAYETKANARLIAAAPDLLEALKIARARLNPHAPYDAFAIEVADAAIVKAKGE